MLTLILPCGSSPIAISHTSLVGHLIVYPLSLTHTTPAPHARRIRRSLSLSLTPAQVFPINNQLYVGLPGFATDTYTLREHLRFRVNMYRMKEEREITPKTFAHLLSSTLYEKR
jgi:hypothetical protein